MLCWFGHLFSLIIEILIWYDKAYALFKARSKGRKEKSHEGWGTKYRKDRSFVNSIILHLITWTLMNMFNTFIWWSKKFKCSKKAKTKTSVGRVKTFWYHHVCVSKLCWINTSKMSVHCYSSTNTLYGVIFHPVAVCPSIVNLSYSYSSARAFNWTAVIALVCMHGR